MGFLENKVFIITGSAKGLGKGFAQEILKENGRVAISDILEEEGLKTTKKFKETFGHDKVTFIKADVTSHDDWKILWQETESYFNNPVYCLVNNAGVDPFNTKCVDINLHGVMNGTNLAFEKMSKHQNNAGQGGLVINIASMLGLTECPTRNFLPYIVSKTGVVSFTRGLGTSSVYKKDGIKVNCLCPYFADTDLIKCNEETFNKIKTITRGNILNVDEVAQKFMQLLKDEKNGAAMVVMPKMPAIYVNDFRKTELYAHFIVAFIFGNLLRLKSVESWMVVLFMVVMVYFLYLTIKLLALAFFNIL